jgi:hypothetical protein
LFYEPLRVVGRGQHWVVRQQQTIIPKKAKVGARESVDFVIHRKKGDKASRASVLIIEVKYFRGDNPTQDIKNLRADIDKLRALDPATLECASSLPLQTKAVKFLLVICKSGAMNRTLNRKSKNHQAVVTMLTKARGPKRPRVAYRSFPQTHLKEDDRWEIIALGEQRWPD